jgi:hypothetical protein
MLEIELFTDLIEYFFSIVYKIFMNPEDNSNPEIILELKRRIQLTPESEISGFIEAYEKIKNTIQRMPERGYYEAIATGNPVQGITGTLGAIYGLYAHIHGTPKADVQFAHELEHAIYYEGNNVPVQYGISFLSGVDQKGNTYDKDIPFVFPIFPSDMTSEEKSKLTRGAANATSWSSEGDDALKSSF